jgi:predicted RNase H-like HicB family nuclease
MEYTVVIHKAEEGGYWAEVPALEACFSQGDTVEETIENVKEAIESHIIALKSEGRKIPEDDIIILSKVKAA